MFIPADTQTRIIDKLLAAYGPEHQLRIERGVAQAAELWVEDDGDIEEFATFCEAHFIGEEKKLEAAFDTLDRAFESFDGNFTAMEQTLREPLHLDRGELTAVDRLLGQYDPSAHLSDDLLQNKLAFVILLNFPRYSLSEKTVLAEAWSARDWALARMGDLFQSRVRSDIQQELSDVLTAAEAYISEYNICMGGLRDRENRPLFPEDLKLISHWGIRDELKSQYGRKGGLRKQELIYDVMKKIITQEIPAEVINNPGVVWNVFDNKLVRDGKLTEASPEPNSRYRHILDVFHVMQKVDTCYPAFPTYMMRKFELEREIPENEVDKLFTDVLTSPQLAQVAGLISKRLGRDLKAFDIWYDGFKPRSAIPEDELDAEVSAKYPTIDAFRHDIKNILMSLDFSASQADFVGPLIVVEASRGAGHAWGAQMKGGKARLRARMPREGMDYKGYNIAVHELGHTVEQTLSLHGVDYHMLQGVPFSGLSEAFAFVFQNRDLELLGRHDKNPDAAHLRALDLFWSAAEIMAVALVDMKIWNWLYDHPDTTPENLKKATIDIARDMWNRFYADIFSLRDEIILAIYSHMVDYPLYLAEYPLGQVVQFQLEQHLKGKKLGAEMERMCAAGNIIPQAWMKAAVDQEISIAPLLAAVDVALAKIG